MAAKPFLRWAGSKARLLPKLLAYYSSSYQRYIEPFMGSACLFFALNPRRAVLGDINQQLVDTYRIVRDDPDRLHRALVRIPRGKQSYYRQRARVLHDLNPVARAARFIFLNRYCFNGLYRTNGAGHFNVPYSGARTGRLPTLQQLRAVSSALQRSRLVCADFEFVLRDARAGDFVYLDPPYAVSARRVFRQYGANTFSPSDVPRLAKALDHLHANGAHFLVSYALSKDAFSIMSCWPTARSITQRNISGFARHRRRAVELLISNRPIDVALEAP